MSGNDDRSVSSSADRRPLRTADGVKVERPELRARTTDLDAGEDRRTMRAADVRAALQSKSS